MEKTEHQYILTLWLIVIILFKPAQQYEDMMDKLWLAIGKNLIILPNVLGTLIIHSLWASRPEWNDIAGIEQCSIGF